MWPIALGSMVLRAGAACARRDLRDVDEPARLVGMVMVAILAERIRLRRVVGAARPPGARRPDCHLRGRDRGRASGRSFRQMATGLATERAMTSHTLL
jgi:hypothetical protein